MQERDFSNGSYYSTSLLSLCRLNRDREFHSRFRRIFLVAALGTEAGAQKILRTCFRFGRRANSSLFFTHSRFALP